ncbi:MAG: hypothetical protein GXO75_08255 [Calditrichaeota bacterium]|nr:hypothetical protein [Calditrichota bacterium]
MKLYCKLDVEKKEVGYRDHRNRVVKGFIVRPYEPTEIPDHHAREILKQNPHLVDTKPLQKTKEEATETKHPDAENVVTLYEEQNDGNSDDDKEFWDKIKVVQKIAGLKLEDVKTAQIREWGRELGIKIPSNAPKKKQIKMLEERCKELVSQAKEKQVAKVD